uniref:Uncharacterized protein n=1 Tax=Megaselia scalaris TaxID=36166 RepID=T1GYM5_MEGSC
MSHCGKFYYEDRYVSGCLQSCSDADACNSTRPIFLSSYIFFIMILFLLIFTS